MVLVVAAIYTYIHLRKQHKEEQERKQHLEDQTKDKSTARKTTLTTAASEQKQQHPSGDSSSSASASTEATQLSSRSRSDHTHSLSHQRAALVRQGKTITMPSSPQQPASSSTTTTTRTNHPTASTETTTTAPLSVRLEWLNAVFGHDFRYLSEDPQQSSQPHEHSKRPPYSATATTIPAQSHVGTKVGLTIARLPLGLYVRDVQVGSEAAAAGLLPGAVLWSVNGMPLAAEATRPALERMWQYQGFFDNHTAAPEDSGMTGSVFPKKHHHHHRGGSNGNGGDGEKDDILQMPNSNNHRLTVTTPVAMEFVYHGERQTILLLSNPACSWGISWASCGDFALVRRVYGAAAEAGVKQGSLLVGVQKETVQYMDHTVAAAALSTALEQKKDIQLVYAFPPAMSRSAYYERLQQQQQQQSQNGNGLLDHSKQKQMKDKASAVKTKSHDGVEVKFHPLEYAIGSLCHSGGLPHDGDFLDGADNGSFKLMQDLAEQVAAGEMEAPFRWSPQKQRNAGAGLSDKDHANTTGNTGRLVSKAFASNSYSRCPVLAEDALLQYWDPLEFLVYSLRFAFYSYEEESFVSALQRPTHETLIETLQALTSGPKAAFIVSSFLLQFISLICSPGGFVLETEENKSDDTKINYNNNSGISKKEANELTSILLKLSRKDEGFCQRLYFILRSYISTFETKTPTRGKEENSKNLMALLHCLELLRFAEKELAGRKLHSGYTASSRYNLKDDSMGTLIASSVVRSVSEPTSPAPSGQTTGGSNSNGATDDHKKGKFGFFRKKKGKGNTTPKSTPQKGAQKSSSLRNVSAKEQQKENVANSPNTSSLSPPSITNSLTQSPSTMYENMSDFLGDLDRICSTIERSLQKSFRQKIADWASQPWSASKDTALAKVTSTMRDSLKEVTEASPSRMLLVNPVDSAELLSSVDYNECYILPSAHFPVLLTFNVSERRSSDSVVGEERLYRTCVELLTVKGPGVNMDRSFVVHGAVAGTISETGSSKVMATSMTEQSWGKRKFMIFQTRSSWGAPQTLSLRLSSKGRGSPPRNGNENLREEGYCWIDLSKQWTIFGDTSEAVMSTCKVGVRQPNSATSTFDEHGELVSAGDDASQQLELTLKVTTDCMEFDEPATGSLSRKRMLLYKHDDDLRQEAFATHFIDICDKILRASGLDMRLLTFQCIPVGVKRGFVEWVPGSVPLSEICQPFAGSILGSAGIEKADTIDDDSMESPSPSMFTKAGLSKFESLRRLGGQQNESLRRIGGKNTSSQRGSLANNPIQDYLRSVAFDPNARYLIRKDVMDTYVKSCAGYSIITYILGVGDRHLDNLLLHQSGSFFHCDYSFILGNDPKKYFPLRITEDMVLGMGGKESDNYAKFLSLMSSAFIALRRPENVRVLLSTVRLMEASCLPDISENQSIQEAIMGVRDRLRLDLSEGGALAYIEELVETSLNTRLWLAVDAIHTLGKLTTAM